MQDYGQFLRAEREALGLRQCDLAEGICSIDTISRIERGSQIPTAALFSMLVERLGVFGFSYGDIPCSATLALMQLRERIILAFDRGGRESLPQLLDEYEELLSVGEIWDEQFFLYAKARFLFEVTGDPQVYYDNCCRAIRMTIRGFEPGGRLCGRYLNHVEIAILNAMVMSFYHMDCCREALMILYVLIDKLRRLSNRRGGYCQCMAVLFNNAALCEASIPSDAARGHLEEAIVNVYTQGSKLLEMRLLRTKIAMTDHKDPDYVFLNRLLKYEFLQWNRRFRCYESFGEFQEESKFLSVM